MRGVCIDRCCRRHQGEVTILARAARGGSATAYSIEVGDVGRDGEDFLRFCLDWLPGYSRDKFTKYFERNPLGKPEFVVARSTADGRIVGVAALHPQQILVDGDVQAVAIAGDFAVEENLRGFGPALAMQRELVSRLDSRGWSFAYGLPNPAASAVLRRAGYRELGPFSRLCRRLTRSERLAAALGLGAIRRASRSHPVLCLSEFDSRFEALWAEAGQRAAYAPAPGVGVRNWRYELSPNPSQRFSLTVTAAGDAVTAYSVAMVAWGMRRVVELSWLDDASLRAVVAAELVRAARERLAGVDLLYLGPPDYLAPALTPLGFVEDPAPTVIVYPAQRVRSDPGHWLLFEGAIDV